MNLATEARQFLRSTNSAMLSTMSAKFSGYPFCSVAPFVLDHSGQPVILISTIAEHTQNILADPKLSLLVFAGNEDLQASARLTLIGQATSITKDDEHLRARYLRYLPQASSYFAMHDFSFYRIEVVQARYIAGFGKMGWVSADDISGAKLSSALASQETGIVEHMNADHGDSLISYCRHFHGVDASHAHMLGIDSDGFDARVTVNVNPSAAPVSNMLRFNFDQPIHDAIEARQALVAMTRAAKA
jgi:hypothetical protein